MLAYVGLKKVFSQTFSSINGNILCSRYPKALFLSLSTVYVVLTHAFVSHRQEQLPRLSVLSWSVNNLRLAVSTMVADTKATNSKTTKNTELKHYRTTIRGDRHENVRKRSRNSCHMLSQLWKSTLGCRNSNIDLNILRINPLFDYWNTVLGR